MNEDGAWSNDAARDDWRAWRKTSLSATLSTINPTQTDLRLNLGLCSDMAVTNYLGCHRPFCFLFLWGSSEIFERMFEAQILHIASVSSLGKRLFHWHSLCVYKLLTELKQNLDFSMKDSLSLGIAVTLFFGGYVRLET